MGVRIALNHQTHYRYDRQCQLGPHVVRLRPAPHCRTRIESYSLQVVPGSHFINWQQDPFGNYLARLVFPELVEELSIEVDLIADLSVINPFDFFVEEYAEQFPFVYDESLRTELSPWLAVCEDGPLLRRWCRQHMPAAMPVIDWLVALNQALKQTVDYQVRMQPGVQSCEQTLERATGSCRDSAWLLVQVLRRCGLAARFVSGYLVQLQADEPAIDGPSGPDADFTDLHAWAETYLPGAGWVGLDPTSGLFAGEGHIPLSCTPMPDSAAPVSGATNTSASDFRFSNTVCRIEEKPRPSKPYTEQQWQEILQLGDSVDARLAAGDVRLTMGGEPTFVSLEHADQPEWNHTASSAHKLQMARQLMQKLRPQWAPGSSLTFSQGKWYPGEATPRWALACHWRKDGKPLWHSPETLAHGAGKNGTRNDAQRFTLELAHWLGVDDACVKVVHEDPLYHLQLESLLPVGKPLSDLGLDDSTTRRNLANRLSQGLGQPAGWMFPLQQERNGWSSCVWSFRREEVFLVPGDSPAGLRLPLDALPEATEDPWQGQVEDNFFASETLPWQNPLADEGVEAMQPLPVREPVPHTIHKALCVEWRDAALHVFLPPTHSAAGYVKLLQSVEKAALVCAVSVVLEGYEPPEDSRVESFRITPDPGVIEVNVHPVSSFRELVTQTESLYTATRQTGLSAEKFMLDGRPVGTGGGGHITLGGPTPADSPFLRRPDLLGSMITFWQHHPSLSYLFSGLFVGPGSQAPRVDEARHEALYELEQALSLLPPGECDQPWLVDRTLRNLLADTTGNTHRTEICIDKLYAPEGPAGRQGLVELRAFEMPPHARMSVVQALLLRALVSRFRDQPYTGKLVRWGSELHDRFMLPHYLWADISDVVTDLNRHGIEFELDWLLAFREFRFPVYGLRQVGDITLELRAAIEPWHVLGEQATESGMSRYVDSSMERLQLKVTGLNPERFQVSCNGNVLPLRSTGCTGEYVVGVRYRAWQPANCLHPDLPVDSPLVFDVVDQWMQRSLGGCAWHISHPGGRHYEEVPVNANVAQARRLARFDPFRHTPQAAATVTPDGMSEASFSQTDARNMVGKLHALQENPEFPHTADLRRARAWSAGFRS